MGLWFAARFTPSTHVARWLSPRRLATGTAFFARYGHITIFLARFTPGLRAATFVLAGTMQMTFWRFVVIDTLAGLIFVPALCLAGYLFADHIDLITSWFEGFEQIVVALAILTGVSWFIWRLRGKRERQITSMPVEGD